MGYLNKRAGLIGIVLTLIITALIISSCTEDYLSVNPKGELSRDVLANEQGVRGLLMAAYSPLNDNGAEGSSIFATRSTHFTMSTDESFPGSEGLIGTAAPYKFYTTSPTNGGLHDRWTFFYDAIQRCNDVINLLNSDDLEIPANKAERFRAEARALRGYYHSQLVFLFRNIPYVDETVSFANENYYISNTEPVWPKIEEDYQFAIDHLGDTAPNPGNLNKWAVKALLAKAYMFQLKFSEAKPLLEDIIANGVTSNGEKYALMDQYHWNFNTQYKNGPEAVFQVQVSVYPDGNNGNQQSLGSGPYGGPGATFGWLQPSFEFADRFQTQNGLPLIDSYNETPIKHDHGLQSTEEFTPEQGTLDPRLDWSLGRRGIPYLDHGVMPGRSWVRNPPLGGPYLHKKEIGYVSRPDEKNGINYAVQYNIIRFADVLLWAAEVEVEIGSLDQAEMYVNRVRERAANPDGFVKKYIDQSNPQEGFSNENAANYEISLYNGHFTQNGQEWARRAVRFERVLEIGMEHHRFIDLQRYNEMDPGYMGIRLNEHLQRTVQRPHIDLSYFTAEPGFTQGQDEFYPIPQEEIDLSVNPETGEPTLIQNPGYN